MEVPFDITTQNKFEEEFKQALGFVDANIPYAKIKPDINLAVTELLKVVGKPSYDALIANYKLNIEGTDQATAPYQDTDLTEYFRTAIAAYAYMEFAPANNLAHTANGRRMLSSGNQKTPFEWMMASDDDNLKRRAYKAIDALINYMDSNFDTWKGSDQFKVTHKLFVRTLDDFSSAYVLDSRLLLLKLVPGLTQCESREIQPRLGSEYLATLREKVIYKASGQTGDASKTITDDEQLLISYIKDACAYYSLYWALPRMQVQLFPEGILQAVRSDRETIKGRKTPEFPVIDQASKLFKEDADRTFLVIENLITKMFPPEVIEDTEAESDDISYGFGDDDNFVNT